MINCATPAGAGEADLKAPVMRMHLWNVRVGVAAE